jgi:hypothetical protein
MMDLEERGRRALRDGPTRVVVSKEGEAVPTPRARQEFGAEADVIFIRDDGWTLGAPKALVRAAEATWSDLWVGVAVAKSGRVMTYERWKAGGPLRRF